MNLQISGHHVEVTPAMREHVTEGLKTLSRHFGRIIRVGVIFSIDNNKASNKDHCQKVAINLHIGGRDLNADYTNGNMYTAIDNVMKKLDGMLKRHKGAVQGNRRATSSRRVVMDSRGKLPKSARLAASLLARSSAQVASHA